MKPKTIVITLAVLLTCLLLFVLTYAVLDLYVVEIKNNWEVVTAGTTIGILVVSWLLVLWLPTVTDI